MRRSWAVLLAVLALSAALVTGCSSGSSDSGSSGEAGGGDAGSSAALDTAGGQGGAEAAAEEPGPVQAPTDGRQVVTTGEVSVVVDDPRAAADEVTAEVERRGGRVDARSERAGEQAGRDGGAGRDEGREDGAREGASASLVVRVPSDQVSDTLAALRELGEVGSVTISSDDVTGAAQDLDARIDALRASVERLEALIADASTTADLITAEQALTDRQGALEQLVAQRAGLAEQVSLSTLSVSLTTEPAEAAVRRVGFTGGLSAGWSGLRTTAAAAAVVAGALLPWLVVAGALGAAAVALRRRLRHRRAARSGAVRSSGPPARA